MRSNSTLRSSRVRVALLQLLAQRAEQLHRDRVLVAVALLEREPDLARQGRACAARRDGDREVAAPHYRGQDEVAQVRDVDDVAEHLPRAPHLRRRARWCRCPRSPRSPGSIRRGRRSRTRAARARSVPPRPSARTCSVASSETTCTVAPAFKRPADLSLADVCRLRRRARSGRRGRGSPGSRGGCPSRGRARATGRAALDAPGAVLALRSPSRISVARSRRFSASAVSVLAARARSAGASPP